MDAVLQAPVLQAPVLQAPVLPARVLPARVLPGSLGLRSVIADILLNTVVPYSMFLLLRQCGVAEPRALIAAALVPAVIAVASLVRRRRINGLSLLVLAINGLVLLASVLSGSAWFALVQPSFVTGALALGFLASLALSRPVLFYLARDTTCPTAAEARAFEAKWELPGFRSSMRYLTLIWAAFLAGEAAFRLVLVSIWPSPALVAASQILWIVAPFLLIRWSIRAGGRWSGR